ncbi:ATP-binding protein [Arthrobacter sp.]|uniref:sensor histidine kinase n=1 Tax=Arthrobacter sp. TaxID=1667 RepID=UPI0028114032|nr:ATP-binding protein [Arthrobacter sp.]
MSFQEGLGNPLLVGFLLSQLGILLLCYVVPWDRLPYTSYLIIPLLDFVSIAVGSEGGEEGRAGIGLLAVFPVIWLCASGFYPRSSLWLSFLAPLGITWLPAFLHGTVSVQDLTRPLLVPVTIFMLGFSIRFLTRSVGRQQRVLRQKDELLQANLRNSQRQESLLNTILETVNVGVLAVDAEGNDILMNRKQRANHEVAMPLSTPGAGSQIRVLEADRTTPVPAEERPYRRALLGETFTDYPVWLGTGKEQRAISVAARPIKDPDGKFIGSVLSFSDVTELMNALAVKDVFVSNVSHELRTPLTSILGYIELLQDGDLAEDQKQPMEIIRKNSERLLILVSDLLALGHDKSVVRREPVDVAELVRACVSAALPKAADCRVDLQVSTPERLDVNVDASSISQVVENLVSNAIKYSPGGGNVLVALEQQDGELVCRVSDTGMGMNTEDQAKVFTKFFRAGNVRESTIPGAGLGLSISKDIVEAHGGTIDERLWMGDTVTWFHRTIEQYVGAINGAGFNLTALRECEPEPGRFGGDEAELVRRRRVPLFLLLSARAT